MFWKMVRFLVLLPFAHIMAYLIFIAIVDLFAMLLSLNTLTLKRGVLPAIDTRD